MATSLTLENDSSLAQGYIKVNGSTAATLTTSGITGNVTGNVTGSLTTGGSLTLATAQTASGTAVDFTSIPSWVKRITVMFDGVSLTGTDALLVQLGGSGGIENTGYNSWSIQISTTPATSAVVSTSGFIVYSSNNPDTANGAMSINLVNANTWAAFGSASSSAQKGYSFAGGKQLLSTLDRIRITRSGTNTFDAGTINISYEG